MRIIIEEYQYPAERVDDVLQGVSTLRNIYNKVSVNYVGYYYNPTLKDCVFILPKVLIDEQGRVFGHYRPEDIIDLEKQKLLSDAEYQFIYELSVWIYRTIVVYRDSHPESQIVYQQYVQQMSKGRLRQCNTYLDILLALQKFNRDNQNFFFYVLKNIHSGFNKINWTKTIGHSQAFVQNNEPIYLNPVNKRKRINFDEELIVIYFSILNHLKEEYGFPVKIDINIPLITGAMFDNLLEKTGKARLMRIKYKYFSDKALYLWELCYAFFDKSKKINIETDDREYLLVQNFNIVFEAIIDELVGDQIPEDEIRLRKLKEQPDGKMVDHIYTYQELTSQRNDKPVYYIGDSKYYKSNTIIGEEAVAKQFTYAKNIIQWNLDLFNDPTVTDAEREGHQKLRDDFTEGYNIIPNFFISAQQKNLKREDTIYQTDKSQKCFVSSQFDNRLFDRDTFIVAHYDVNFLFVIGLYGKNNRSEKAAWKKKIRDVFRAKIQDELQRRYKFYAMTPHSDVNASAYIQEHFQQLLGKIFTPYDNFGLQSYYSLALNREEKFEADNEALVGQLKQAFYVEECQSMDDNPAELLSDYVGEAISKPATHTYLTFHYLEKYKEQMVLVCGYRGEKHLQWINGQNDRGTLLYNIRLGKNVKGGQIKAQLDKKAVCFAVLFDYSDYETYKVYRVHHHATMTKERLIKTGYPFTPSADKYFCYVFDEEVTLGLIDIKSFLAKHKFPSTPLFVTGEEIMEYRK